MWCQKPVLFSRFSYLPWALSVSLTGPIRLSLYESSIRSSVPTTCPLSLTLHQREALCQIPGTSTTYPWVFILPMSLGGAGGWLAVCSRTAVENAEFWGVSECERGRGGGCSTADSTSYHMGRLQKGRLAGSHTFIIADGMLRMGSYLGSGRSNATRWLKSPQPNNLS